MTHDTHLDDVLSRFFNAKEAPCPQLITELDSAWSIFDLPPPPPSSRPLVLSEVEMDTEVLPEEASNKRWGLDGTPRLSDVKFDTFMAEEQQEERPQPQTEEKHVECRNRNNEDDDDMEIISLPEGRDAAAVVVTCDVLRGVVEECGDEVVPFVLDPHFEYVPQGKTSRLLDVLGGPV